MSLAATVFTVKALKSVSFCDPVCLHVFLYLISLLYPARYTLGEGGFHA